MRCPIHPFSEDLNEGRDVADDAFTGVGLMTGRSVALEPQVCVSSRLGDLKLRLMSPSPRAAVAGFNVIWSLLSGNLVRSGVPFLSSNFPSTTLC